jgi:hypothetical protein
VILDRLSIFRAIWPFRGGHKVARETASRWQRAADRDPGLMRDIVALGRVLSLRPALFQDGAEVPEPIDPVRLAYDQGRRDLAVQIIALMGVTETELAQLLENDHAD